MGIKVFYAWQADRPMDTCRFLIRSASVAAAKGLNSDAELKPAPRVLSHDHTKHVPRPAHVATSVAGMIAECDVFLADLTHVATYMAADGRAKRAQNAEVLVELGMAIQLLGFHRLILVINNAFGGPEHLPFDLAPYGLPIQYLLQDTDDALVESGARRNLSSAIFEKLQVMLPEITAEHARVEAVRAANVGGDAPAEARDDDDGRAPASPDPV